jgi:hypothetical protein
VFPRVYIQKVNGIANKGQEIPQWLMYRHVWRPFQTCPQDLPNLLMHFLGKKYTAKLPVLGLFSSSDALSALPN